MEQRVVGRWRVRRVLQVKISKTKNLQLECARDLCETLLLLFLIYGNETMLWKEEERSRIRAVHIDNLRSLLGNKRMECTDKRVVRSDERNK